MHRRKQIWNTETFVVQNYQKTCTTWLLSDNGVSIDQQLNWATLSHCLHACDFLCCVLLSKRGSCWKEIETCCLIMHANGLRAEASVHGTQALGFIHLHTLSQGNTETLPMGSDLFYSVLNAAFCTQTASVVLIKCWDVALVVFRHSFPGDHYVEFSKLSQDRVIGTKEHIARVRMAAFFLNLIIWNEMGPQKCSCSAPSPWQIYDIQTGQLTQTLNNPDLANNYKRNCATFNPTDDLVLNDGVLWDVRTAQAIHKFDKFNMNISGVFHPNGMEVIVNTEIVSLRLRVYSHASSSERLYWAKWHSNVCGCRRSVLAERWEALRWGTQERA